MSAPDDAGELARNALARLSEKWTARVLGALAAQPLSYGVLHRQIGLSEKVLTLALRTLQRDGYVTRMVSPSARLQVTYDLTALGRSLLELMGSVEAWARERITDAPPAYPAPSVACEHRAPDAERDEAPRARLDALPSHLCIAVQDLEKASAMFSECFGIDRGPLTVGTVTSPDQVRGGIRRRAFRLGSFVIEMIQPTEGPSAFSDFLGTSGQGIHHIGLRSRSSLEDQMRLLERRGGRRTMGSLEESYGLYDFSDQFGTTLEVVTPEVETMSRGSVPARLREEGGLAHHSLCEVGILVRDVDRAAAHFVEVVGVAPQPVRTASVVFPGGRPDGTSVRIVSVRQGQLATVLIEPVGSSPWLDFVEERGNAMHHISFNVGDRLDALVETFRKSGSEQVLGREGLGYAHFDFTREFGLVVGLIGTGARP